MKTRKLLSPTLLLLSALLFTSCEPGKEAIKYQVTFMNGEEVFATQEVEENQTASIPTTAPTKAEDAHYHYDFHQWLKDDEVYDFTTPVVSDLTLHASFKETLRQYLVTFIHQNEEYEKATQDAGSVVTPPSENPTWDKDGYTTTFLGWSTDGTKETIVTEFPTDLVSDLTYYSVFSEEIITYIATLHHDYEGGPSDEEFPYNIENREQVYYQILDKLPPSDEIYQYAFRNPFLELPLSDATYDIIRTPKGFDYDFNDNELPEKISFLDRGSVGEDKFGVVDGAMYARFGNDVLHTNETFKYFQMEFAAKFVKNEGQSGERFCILLGMEDSELNKVYDTCFNSIGRNALMFVNGTNGAVRYYANGEQAAATVVNLASAPGFGTEFVNFKIIVNQKGLSILINDVSVMKNVALAAKLGKILICRADYQGTLSFDHFRLSAIDGVVPPSPKSFTTDFSEADLPAGLTFKNRHLETYQIADGKFVSQLNNSNLHTTETYGDFEISMRAKASTGRIVIEFGETDTNTGYVGGKSVKDQVIGIMFCCDGGSNPAQMRFFDNNVSGTNFTSLHNTKKPKAEESNLINNFVDLTLTFANGKVSGTIDGEVIIDQIAVTTIPLPGHIMICGGAAETILTLDSFAITDLN